MPQRNDTLAAIHQLLFPKQNCFALAGDEPPPNFWSFHDRTIPQRHLPPLNSCSRYRTVECASYSGGHAAGCFEDP
jgi:hypothetical protein